MSVPETKSEQDKRFQILYAEAEKAGYHLNPVKEFTLGLIEGLTTNKNRFGYEACPCRLAVGSVEEDRDIVCPCDYRDDDLTEFGACYCGLYLSAALIDAGKEAPVIPERRPSSKERATKPLESPAVTGKLSYPVWRCKVCGYLAARNTPPEVCPICHAKSDRFEIFMS
jgi:ferredoxin-thioredoxin reductase catalytic subunit